MDVCARAGAGRYPGAFLWESCTCATEDEAVESWPGGSQQSRLAQSSLPWLLSACPGLVRDVLAGRALWEGEGLSSRAGARTCITSCADLGSGAGQQNHMAGEGDSAQGEALTAATGG